MEDKNFAHKTIIDVLLKEYDHRFTEVMFYAEKYHNKSMYLQAYFTIIILLFSFLFSDKSNVFTNRINQVQINIGMIIILLLLLSALFFLFNSLFESLFLIKVNAARKAYLEKKINSLLQNDYVIWDSKISNNFFIKPTDKKVKWGHPNLWMGFWGYASYFILSTLLCSVSFLFLYKSWWLLFSVVYSILILSFSIYHIIQFNRINSCSVKKFIKEDIVKDFEIN